MTINELRELLAEEHSQIEEYLDRLNDVTDGDQFSVEDNMMLGIIKDMLAICSLEQVETRRAAVIAARHHKMVEDGSLPF